MQALRGDGLDARHSFERRRDDTLGPDDSHRAGVLRHQDVAVGQERDRPRAGQPGRDRLRVERRRRLGRARRVGLPGERGLGLGRLGADRRKKSRRAR